MKTLWLSGLVCLETFGLWAADPVIKFDDLPANFIAVPAGYHGLNWSGLTSLNGVSYASNPSGYQAGVVSPDSVIYGGGGGTGVISAPMFDLNSAYATAAWNDNLQFEAKGYIKGTLVYDLITSLSATNPTLVQFNFYGVDEVDFTSSGGTHHAGYVGVGANFALDNVNVTTYVPYAPALITNPGFESGDFFGWSHFGNTNSTLVTTSATFVHSGVYGAEIGPVATPGYLSQPVGPTQIGESYSVSCWLTNAEAGANYFTLSWGGFPAFGLTNQPVFGWTNLQFNLLATRPSEALEFQFRNDPSYFGFDDVSVTPSVLVSNGGFEIGDYSGWTQSGITGQNLISANKAYARSGTFGAEIGPSGGLGYLSQNLTTTPGMAYLVSLWLDCYDGATPNEFLVRWNGNTLFDWSNVPLIGWTNLHFVVTASSTNSVLQLGIQNSPSYFGLDEVSVIPIPLLRNGGFEFGDFTGWTTGGNFQASGVSTNSLYANADFYGGYFGPVTTLGYLSQTLPTVPGQAYVIGFTVDIPTPMTNSEFNVAWNGTTLIDTTNSGLIGWLPFNFLVTAPGTNSTLQFGFRDDPAYLGLDEVYVAPVMAPKFQSVTKHTNQVDLAWSAWPGYWYQLQYKTNLLGNIWTSLGNYFYPTNFPVSATDTNAIETTKFYRIQMAPPPLIF